MKFKFITSCAEETVALGRKIGGRLKAGDVVAMRGTLGAGKTTITKGIALALGVEDVVTSPTFCLVSEYSGKTDLCHIDAYRLDGADDFESIGAQDMMGGDNVCVIEWSENVEGCLPDDAIKITMKILDGGKREIEVARD